MFARAAGEARGSKGLGMDEWSEAMLASAEARAAMDALVLRYGDLDRAVLLCVLWMPHADPEGGAATRFQLGEVLRVTEGWLGAALDRADALAETLAGAAAFRDVPPPEGRGALSDTRGVAASAFPWGEENEREAAAAANEARLRAPPARRTATLARVEARTRRKLERRAMKGLAPLEGEPVAGAGGAALAEKAAALRREIFDAGLAVVGDRALAARAADVTPKPGADADGEGSTDDEWLEPTGIAYVDAAVDSIRLYLEFHGTPRPIPHKALEQLETLVIAGAATAGHAGAKDDALGNRVRRRLEPLSAKPSPKGHARAKLLRRYHAAKVRKAQALGEWRVQSRYLTLARAMLARANHEVARCRKHLPTEWRI